MDDIAIIGLSCLFPGAETPDEYWRNLMARKDATTPLSQEELGVDPALYYDPVPGTPDKICYNRNGHVRGFRFDASGYRLPEAELDRLDPLFLWTIYVADQALADAGYGRGAGHQRTGLVIGNIGMPTHSAKKLMSGFYHRMLEPYLQTLLGEPRFRFLASGEADGLSDLNLMTGSHNATIAAQALGLGGPCFALDAACSSALYAIQVASDYLQSGKADLMLAGAVCHADHIYIDHGFNVLQAFPENGQSVPFDRHSEGLKAGEGASVIALKRLSDAVRDKDTIYGVIESIGLSNDGGTKHILVPDLKGQLLSLERAYDGVDKGIDYLECHATGTPVGDQVELGSVEAFFGEAPSLPRVGANKGNIGHMLTASGMASILKVLLSMRHGVIPPTLYVEEMVSTPHGKLGIDHVVRETTPWPQRGAVKRAGINAFGFGGVNGHMVLRESGRPERAAPAFTPPAALAIVGIGVLLAGTGSAEAFDATIRQGGDHLGAVPPTRWQGLEARQDLLSERGFGTAPAGAYIEYLDFDCKHYRLPPKVIGNHLLSHIFLMPVAERAFLDAGYAVDGHKRNIAVIVAGDVDYSCCRYQARNEVSWQLRASLQHGGITLSDEDLAALEVLAKDSLFPEPYPEGITGGIGNVVASRIAAHLKLDGPAFSLSSHENAAFKAIELARFMLTRRKVEAVIVASGSFAGGLENVLWAPRHADTPVGEGCGVLVLKREDEARRDRDRLYAVMRGLDIGHACGDSTTYAPVADAVARSAAAALAEAGAVPADIGYVELAGGRLAGDNFVELEGLARVYGGDTPRPVAGSVSANYGHMASAQGVFSVIKTALCLYHRYLPVRGPLAAYPDIPADGPFDFAAASRDWMAPAAGPRRAAVNSLGIDRAYAHLVLDEPGEACRAMARPIAAHDAPRDKALVTRVYTGRERSMADAILRGKGSERFGRLRRPAPALLTPIGATGSDPYARQLLRGAATQLRYLQAEQQFYRRLRALIGDIPAAELPQPARVSPPPLFDEAQLVELTDGSVARVLGPDYAEADTYPIRTRMPSPPYMFVSRITAMTAEQGKLEPCVVEWEYDLHEDAWYVCDGRVPAFVSLESSHAMIVAFTYIGCDQLFRGQLRYRAVDSQTTVYGEMPRAGEVLRGRVEIKSFLKVGKNILIAYDYYCHVGDRLAFKLTANSGFFQPRDIEKSKGVNPAPYLQKTGRETPFTPPLRCAKSSFGNAEIDALLRGDFAACFGEAYRTALGSRLCAPAAKMLHRVVSVSATGGAFGLGEAIGECDIDPSHWAFKAHFKNDPVMPGTLLVEGCEQLVKFYLGYLGLYSQPDLTAHALSPHHYSAKFRGEVKCEAETLRYRLTCKSAEADGEGIAMVFVAEILYRGNVIGICDNLGAGFVRHVQPARLASGAASAAIEV
ncbi:hotdog fold thioesterase [Paludibacterium paludis]|uniref:Ketosynthase family 3 (KS3) domain-containing protein n=1 Tax=Paludibacterium paludis TaxID=1225769 RepID=A0A918P2I9_9NEIS|nr:beta-ketoacyl synthase N-terminal-like domain-containing protein [Paludibacterium paludis]GGY14846.1 hypothetical protein GCM10011289_17730 [Paludibacterium paludis]